MIERRIYLIRGQKVMLDRDLADKVLNDPILPKLGEDPELGVRELLVALGANSSAFHPSDRQQNAIDIHPALSRGLGHEPVADALADAPPRRTGHRHVLIRGSSSSRIASIPWMYSRLVKRPARARPRAMSMLRMVASSRSCRMPVAKAT